MSPSRLGRYLSMMLLSLAVVVLGGLARQGPVSADSTSEAVRVGSLQEGVSAMRRPVVKITGWIKDIAPAHLLIGEHTLLMEPASRVAGDAKLGLYAMATAKADERGQLHPGGGKTSCRFGPATLRSRPEIHRVIPLSSEVSLPSWIPATGW